MQDKFDFQKSKTAPVRKLSELIIEDMNYKDAFINNFLYLDDFWRRTNLDDLGAFLGSIDPGVWSDFLPADKSFLEMWFNISNREDQTQEKIFYDLLPKYLTEVRDGMNLDLIILLDKIQKESNMEFKIWLDYLEYTNRIVNEHKAEIDKW